MSSYTVGLFLHVLGAAGLFAGAAVQIAAGVRVRAATTGRELAQWATFARSAGAVVAGAAVVSLATGGHLAGVVYGPQDGVNGFTVPFVLWGIVAWVVLLPLGPMIAGPRLRRLAAAGEELGEAPLDTATSADASDGTLWGAAHSLVGLAAGYVWIMEIKPDHPGAILALVGGTAVGWVVGQVVANR